MGARLPDVPLRSQSDERLAGLARSGHDRAFAVIVERYRPELLALARRLRSDGSAEDVVQEAFLNAFTALRSGTEVSHVRGWLYQIVRNAATKIRVPPNVPLDNSAATGETVEDVVQRRLTAMSAVTELAHLPDRQRDALVAVALGGVPGAEAATTMGLSEGALRQLVHRARERLRATVTAVMPWPFARWAASACPGLGAAPDLAASTGVIGAGGVAAKVGALVARGLLATTVTVLPGGDDQPGHPRFKHPTHTYTSRRGTGARIPTHRTQVAIRAASITQLEHQAAARGTNVGLVPPHPERAPNGAVTAPSSIDHRRSGERGTDSTDRMQGTARSPRQSSSRRDSNGETNGGSAGSIGSPQPTEEDTSSSVVSAVTATDVDGSAGGGGSAPSVSTGSQRDTTQHDGGAEAPGGGVTDGHPATSGTADGSSASSAGGTGEGSSGSGGGGGGSGSGRESSGDLSDDVKTSGQ